MAARLAGSDKKNDKHVEVLPDIISVQNVRPGKGNAVDYESIAKRRACYLKVKRALFL